jgi:hypothetical protein
MTLKFWLLPCAALSLSAAAPARAEPSLTCARAMTLVANNPGIESQSIVSIIENQWQSQDKTTLAAAHAPLLPAMTSSAAYMQLLSAQCMNNPGQPLTAAAAQVYAQARQALDGY